MKLLAAMIGDARGRPATFGYAVFVSASYAHDESFGSDEAEFGLGGRKLPRLGGRLRTYLSSEWSGDDVDGEGAQLAQCGRWR